MSCSKSQKYTTDFVKSPQQNQNNNGQQGNGNNNGNEVRARRERDRCLFCCTPKVLMIISVIYLILGAIDAITRLAYINGCHGLYGNLDAMVPSNISYDPSKIQTLNINAMHFYSSYDELWISQTNDVSVTNATVQIRTATRNSGKQFETRITPSSYDINLPGYTYLESFFSLWSFRCVINRVEVILPQQKIATTTTPSSVNINSHGPDVKFQPNTVPYPYPINVKTTSSEIDAENALVTSVSIQSSSGDIKGSFSLQEELKIESTSGDIRIQANTNLANGSPKVGLKSTSGDISLGLEVPNVVIRPTVDVLATSGDIKTDVKLANGITDSQISIKASSGDIGLKLHDSFQGQYQIKTTSGDVTVKTGNNINHNKQGKIGLIDSQGFVNIEATSGDVGVEF